MDKPNQVSETHDDPAAPRRLTHRGIKKRRAIREAVDQLLTEVPAGDLSVATIAQRAGVTRSGFYAYFESKYALLASMLAEVSSEIAYCTDKLDRRQAETPKDYVERVLTEAARVCQHHRPLITACLSGRHVDPNIDVVLRRELDVLAGRIVATITEEVRAGAAQPIAADLTMLVQILTASTTLLAAGDKLLIGHQPDPTQLWHAMAELWATALWGPQSHAPGDLPNATDSSRPTS